MSAPAGEHHVAPVTLSRPRLKSAKRLTMALLSLAATRTRTITHGTMHALVSRVEGSSAWSRRRSS